MGKSFRVPREIVTLLRERFKRAQRRRHIPRTEQFSYRVTASDSKTRPWQVFAVGRWTGRVLPCPAPIRFALKPRNRRPSRPAPADRVMTESGGNPGLSSPAPVEHGAAASADNAGANGNTPPSTRYNEGRLPGEPVRTGRLTE